MPMADEAVQSRATYPARVRRLPSWLVSKAARQVTVLAQERLGWSGLRSDYAVLAGLEEWGPVVQAELGRRIGVDRSDLVAVLDRLEHAGALRRDPDPANRRRNLLTLTDAGRAHLDDLEVRMQRMQADLLAPLPPEDRDRFVRLLEHVVDHQIGRPTTS